MLKRYTRSVRFENALNVYRHVNSAHIAQLVEHVLDKSGVELPS
jgi:hypothetical protein